jgi:predicted transcriptional regulator
MSKLLEQAIEEVRKLSEPEQDEAAELLFALAEKAKGPYQLSEEERVVVEHALAEMERGEFATDEEIAEIFRHHGT